MEEFFALKHWEDRQMFQLVVRQIRKCVGPVGVTISLVHKKLVFIKFETRFDYNELPKSVLFDSHTILSTHSLLIPDTLQDWRTANNPLVKEPSNIRFYCGVPLISKDNQAIGALAIFDLVPNAKFSTAKLKQLEQISEEFMAMLELPLEEFMKARLSRYPNLHSQVDIDLMNLKSELGRATCKGGYKTIFERDGSGNPYLKNTNYDGQKTWVNKKVVRHTLPSHVSEGVRNILKVNSTIKRAFDVVTKSITLYHKPDFTCVLEVRFLESFTIPKKLFPKSTKKINLADFKHKDQMKKVEEQLKTQIRTISKYGGDHEVDKIDIEIWEKAFNSEFGIQLRNTLSNATFNHALVMPFYRVKPNVVKNTSAEEPEDTLNVLLRSGGYILGVFSKSSETFFDAGKISRLYDHVQIVHKECMNK